MSTNIRIGYASVLLASATVLFANAVQAMEIQEFDKMAQDGVFGVKNHIRASWK